MTLETLLGRHRWIRYVAPFAVFIVLTTVQGSVPDGVAWMYPVKTVLVGLILLALTPSLTPNKPSHTVVSVFVGLSVFVVWILPEGLYPKLGAAQAFDPTAYFTGVVLYVWIGVRLIGSTVVVSVMEEFFWRGFLLRWIIKPDFEKVAIGTFSWPSFLLTSVLFASEHNRWLVGLVAGMTYNILLYRTRSLFPCIIAHGLTNLALGIYVLMTGKWGFW